MITWLKFRTNNVTFELNALDVPKDTTTIYKDNVPFDTLIQSIFIGAKDVLNNGLGLFDQIINILQIIFMIGGLFMIIPVIRLTTRLISRKIKKSDKKRSKKSNPI